MTTPDRSSPIQVLLADAIDYAGLFPPAQLDMREAVAEYLSYLESDVRWALGRFVVPAARLEELADSARDLVDPRGDPLGPDRCWLLSVVVGADLASDMDRVREFHSRHLARRPGWHARVQAVELKAAATAAIRDALRVVPAEFERFIEIPLGGDVRALVREIGAAQAWAKARTGGTTADAFPSSNDLVRFLAACIAEDVPFKATAGLHHPVRGAYPLTYAPGSARGTMYGFLNVMLAAALLRAGASEREAREALEEQDAAAFEFDSLGASWRGHHLSIEQLAASRNRAVRSFGSCSFREPIDDLAAVGLL